MNTNKYILKSTDIENMDGERKVHFLNKNAVRINRSLGDTVGMKNLGVHMISVAPGRDTTEFHKHWYEEECIYVISGAGTVTIGDDTYEISQGDFIGFPGNEIAHSLTNNSKQELICLVVGQRLEQEVSEYPNKGKRLYKNSGTWNLVNIADDVDPRN